MNESNTIPEAEPWKGAVPFRITMVIAVVFAVGFVLTFSPTFAVTAVFCCIVAMVGKAKDQYPDRRKDAPAVRIIVMLLVVGFLFLMPPLGVSSEWAWQYPFQRAYIGLYQNVDEPEWLPDFMKDVESDYLFTYEPGLMQGTGHYSVEFVTTRERAAAYEQQFAPQAQYTIPLRSLYSNTYRLPDSGKEITLYWNKDFWAGYWNSESSAQIYVLDADISPNHPHSSAVIIDKATGKVQFSRLG